MDLGEASRLRSRSPPSRCEREHGMRQIHLIGRFSSINAAAPVFPPRLFKEGFTFPVHSLNLSNSLEFLFYCTFSSDSDTQLRGGGKEEEKEVNKEIEDSIQA